jgi:hypothetical protein
MADAIFVVSIVPPGNWLWETKKVKKTHVFSFIIHDAKSK